MLSPYGQIWEKLPSHHASDGILQEVLGFRRQVIT